MVVQLIIILFLGFCCSYPIFLFLTPQNKIKENFYHFNLGLSIIIGSLALLINFLIRYFSLKSNVTILQIVDYGFISIIILLAIITWYYWNKKYPVLYISILSVIGLFLLKINFYFESTSFNNIINYTSSIIGTLTLSSVLFSMILGHWYLNIPNLPSSIIRRSVFVLNVLLILRLILGLIIISTQSIHSPLYGQIKFLYFLQSFEGIILWVGILFGIIGAIIINILTIQTIKLQAIQSATGLLYVNLVMILMGEMIFKYYFLTKNILL